MAFWRACSGREELRQYISNRTEAEAEAELRAHIVRNNRQRSMAIAMLEKFYEDGE